MTVRHARTTTVPRVVIVQQRPPARSNDDRPARREYNSDRPARREYGNDRPAALVQRRSPGTLPRRPPARRVRPAGRSDWNATAPRTAAHEQHVDVVHERLQADAIQATDVDGVSFGDLGLGDNIVRDPLRPRRCRAVRRSRPRRSPRSSRVAMCSPAVAPAPERPSRSARLSWRTCCAPRPVSVANSAASRRRSSSPRRASWRCRSTARSSRSRAASACSPPRSTVACLRPARSVRSRRASTSSSAPPVASKTSSTSASSTSARSWSP